MRDSLAAYCGMESLCHKLGWLRFRGWCGDDDGAGAAAHMSPTIHVKHPEADRVLVGWDTLDALLSQGLNVLISRLHMLTTAAAATTNTLNNKYQELSGAGEHARGIVGILLCFNCMRPPSAACCCACHALLRTAIPSNVVVPQTNTLLKQDERSTGGGSPSRGAVWP
jgi:hypothetical protein